MLSKPDLTKVTPPSLPFVAFTLLVDELILSSTGWKHKAKY